MDRHHPSGKSFEAPAYLNWPGTGFVPSPDAQVAVLRSWNERFGAELVAVLNNHLEFVVSKPPATYEDALALAYEQYAFDDDVLEDRYESVKWLAKDLVGAKIWIIAWE